MKINILVTGSNGQLGSELKELSGKYTDLNFLFTSRKDLDISDQVTLTKFVETKKINTIINCAAYTAVDKAEIEPEMAHKINNFSVRNLAEISAERSIRLIHVSTDYVFNGQGFRPYITDHPTDPVNVYGHTKLEGEKAMMAINPKNSMIIRTSWVYSYFGNNFVKTMLRLGEEREKLNVISDQIGAPTYAKDLADFILNIAIIAQNRNTEIYHFSNEGVCSWFDFAKEIMEQANINCEISPISTIAYPTASKRPYYSVLDTTKTTENFNYKIPYWKESLKECIKKLI